MKIRKKSSKKVSIAENLNCDYSDICDLNEETPLSSENEGNYKKACDENCLEEEIDQTVRLGVEELVLNLLFFIFLSVFKMIHICYQLPVFITVILVILVLINFYFTWPLNSIYTFILFPSVSYLRHIIQKGNCWTFNNNNDLI